MSGVELNKLLSDMQYESINGEMPEIVYGVTQDFELIAPGFIYAVGTVLENHNCDNLYEASIKGAVLMLVDETAIKDTSIPTIMVNDFIPALAYLRKAIYGDLTTWIKSTGMPSQSDNGSELKIVSSINLISRLDTPV
ncbi:MAG: hypothetical protein P9X24_12420 [Candidatus Hatepunaea meridiana]|nr:hypothetical protein [Candidatus Hatepunaea meridiana]